MSFQEQIIRQRNFGAGEINPDAIRRDDLDTLKIAIRYGRNLVSNHTGGLEQRPGRKMLFTDDGVIGQFKPFDEVSYTLVFVAGAVKIRTEDNALVATLSAPWGSDDLDSLVWDTMDNEAFVTWGGRTQVITIQENTLAWSIAPYSFSTGINGAVRVPFYRFDATRTITLKPSARTGAINIQFSSDVLAQAHVGAIFRYSGRQILITSVANAQFAAGAVLEELPFTLAIGLSSGAGYSIGQVVETDTSNVKGEVVSIVGNTVTIVCSNTLTIPVPSETLVGPNASSEMLTVDFVTPAAAVSWDEQFISDYRGWPRSVSKDRERLIFSNFKQKKNAIGWSAAGDNRDFEIGSDADDAMLEFISADCQVYHVVGGYDEFAITDKGVFYIPISDSNPLKPGSVDFLPIFSSELANVKPVQVTEGVIFIDKTLTGVYAITATGQVARPYLANEVNALHRHLFDDVKSIAVSSGSSIFPSRQIYVVNNDGSVVVGQFDPATSYIGWLKWDGFGNVRSVSGSYGRVVFMTNYPFASGAFSVAEELDYTLLCDASITFDGSDASDFLQLNDGSPFLLNDGSKLAFQGIVTDLYAGKEVAVFGDGFYLGEMTVGDDGIIPNTSDYGDITIGVRFDWEFEPLFPNPEGGQAAGQGEQLRKIAKMRIKVRDTQEFQVGNRIFGSYRGGEDMSLPVPKRAATYKYRENGRSDDPIVSFSSTFPCAFKLIELFTRITL